MYSRPSNPWSEQNTRPYCLARLVLPLQFNRNAVDWLRSTWESVTTWIFCDSYGFIRLECGNPSYRETFKELLSRWAEVLAETFGKARWAPKPKHWKQRRVEDDSSVYIIYMSPEHMYVYNISTYRHVHRSESAFGKHPVQLGVPHSLYTSMYVAWGHKAITRYVPIQAEEGATKKTSNHTAPCVVELAGPRQCHHRG